MAGDKIRIMIVAGEPSGDALGGPLMAALKERLSGDVEFLGVGGEAMSGQGLQSLFPISDIAVMGLAEILPRLGLILRRLRQTVDLALSEKPDVLITIDAPGFNFRLGRKLRGHGIPIVHYVAPTVWAWKPGRAKKIAGFLDHLLAVLPFEPPYFEAEGLSCTFVGHTAVSAAVGDGKAFRVAHGIPADALVLGILPGSRQGEISRLLPVFRETATRLAASHPNLHLVSVTLSHLQDTVRAGLGSGDTPLTIVGADEKASAFAAMNGALAASGTVALELSLAAVPVVVAYRMNPLTMAIVRRMAQVDMVSLTNLVLEREVIPEFLQERCTPGNLTPAVEKILVDEQVRSAQIEAGRQVAAALGAGGLPPAERAADVVLQVLETKSRFSPQQKRAPQP